MNLKIKIIITSIISIIAIVASIYTIMYFSGDKSIIGEWSYKTNGYEYKYIFNEDKTGTYIVSDTKMVFTYEDNNESISLLFDGNTSPRTMEYKITGRNLHLINSIGRETVYTRVK